MVHTYGELVEIKRIFEYCGEWHSWNIEEIKIVEDGKRKDLKAKNYLFQSIERNVLETILKRETSKDIWDSTKQKYQGST